MVTRSIRIEAPGWLDDVADPSLGPDAPDEKRMAWLLDVLDRQVDEKTGGPFAAAVFSGLTGEVLGVGVNRVEPTSTCVAHAERPEERSVRKGCFRAGRSRWSQ